MKSFKDPRHIARVISAMDLYKLYFASSSDDAPEINLEELEIGNFSKVLYKTIFDGVKEHAAEIDELINKYSDPIKTVDLDTLLLQIIRIAVYEGFISKSVPAKVAVDEAIELSRDFGLDHSTRKVSGILGKIHAELAVVKVETKNDSDK